MKNPLANVCNRQHEWLTLVIILISREKSCTVFEYKSVKSGLSRSVAYWLTLKERNLNHMQTILWDHRQIRLRLRLRLLSCLLAYWYLVYNAAGGWTPTKLLKNQGFKVSLMQLFCGKYFTCDRSQGQDCGIALLEQIRQNKFICLWKQFLPLKFLTIPQFL